MTSKDPPARADLPVEQTWGIEAIYAAPDAWEQEAAAFPESLGVLSAYAGRLGESWLRSLEDARGVNPYSSRPSLETLLTVGEALLPG